MGKRNGSNSRRNGDLIGDIVKGAVAGAIGVWVMDRVGWDMYLSEDPKAFEQEKEAQVEGKYAAHVAVGKIADAMGKELTETQQHKAGKVMHYGARRYAGCALRCPPAPGGWAWCGRGTRLRAGPVPHER